MNRIIKLNESKKAFEKGVYVTFVKGNKMYKTKDGINFEYIMNIPPRVKISKSRIKKLNKFRE